jgi:hypothetical protein
MRHQVPVTVLQFYEDFPLPALFDHLKTGEFARGLPSTSDLNHYSFVIQTLRDLLRDDVAKRPLGHSDLAIHTCHTKGWIHSDLDATGPVELVKYSFPSFLHKFAISWKLMPSDHIPNFPSLLKMCQDVISLFKPSHFMAPHHIGWKPEEGPSEAQYQHEFYRCLHDATFGNVRISPEFASSAHASARGRIDLFLSHAKWGIEMLRNGEGLLEHHARFGTTGAYGAWLQSDDMKDFILLDFRMQIPTKPHPCTLSRHSDNARLIIKHFHSSTPQSLARSV